MTMRPLMDAAGEQLTAIDEVTLKLRPGVAFYAAALARFGIVQANASEDPALRPTENEQCAALLFILKVRAAFEGYPAIQQAILTDEEMVGR